jgi:hypothetical protein
MFNKVSPLPIVRYFYSSQVLVFGWKIMAVISLISSTIGCDDPSPGSSGTSSNEPVAADANSLDYWAADFALRNRGYAVMKNPDGERITVDQADDLSRVLSDATVQLLVIGEGDPSKNDIAKIAKLKAIQSLQFVNANVTDEELQPLSQAASSGLTEFRLETGSVSDACMTHISGMTSLSNLILKGCPIQGEGLENFKSLANLKQLDLSDTKLTDAALAHILQIPNLSSLNLKNTPITDVGLVHLKKATSLEYCNLSGTKVTPEEVKKLQDALPDCTIKND